jgi:GH24 family phage-related lysozyme (muramidase)
MLALIPSVIVPGGLAAKAAGKAVPKLLKADPLTAGLGKSVQKGIKTFTEFTVAGAVGEQIGWDIYEPRLANLIGDFVADDDSAKSDIMRYLEADRDDPQMEARVGVLVESMMLSGGLAFGWMGTKKLTTTTFNKALKPATKAVMDNLKKLRKLNPDDKRFMNFIRNLSESTQYGKKFPSKDKPHFFGKDHNPMVEGEDLSKLWHFKASGSFGDVIRKQAFDWIGGPFMQSRGYFTPRLFEVWRASQNAKGAWSSRAIRITERLEGKLSRVAVDLFKGRGSRKLRKRYVDDTFEKVQSYLDGESIRLVGWKKSKKITLRSKTNGKFDIPKEIRENLREVRTLQDDLSELLAKSDLVSPATKKIITSNLGTYLRRSYDLFEAKGWKPTANVIQRAENYFIKEYRNQIISKDGKTYFKDTQRKIDSTGNSRTSVKNHEITTDKRKTIYDAEGEIVANPNYGQDIITIDKNVQIVDDYLISRAKGDISSILGSNKSAKNVLDYVDHVNGILPSTVAKRKNLDPAFRALLGQTTDPRSTIVNSIAKVADFVETDQFIKNAFKLGEGKYFFKDETVNAMGRFTERMEGNNLGILKNYHTTKEISRIFNQKRIYSTMGENDAYSYLLALKGYGQASKTVLNHITHLRNTIGGATFMLANGRNPFSKETGEAFKILKNELDLLSTRKKGPSTGLFKDKEYIKEYDDLYEKFRSLGIVNNNVRAGEFRQLIEDASKFGVEETSNRAMAKLTGVKVAGMNLGENMAKGLSPVMNIGQRAKKIALGAQKLYIAEDDIFKIASYMKELDTLKRANNFGPLKATAKHAEDTTHLLRPIGELEQEAARIVRNTLPNYDLVPQGLKQLRKMPIGNYFSFPAEMFRTSWHIMRQGGRELTDVSPIIQARGAKRLAGFTGVGLLGSEAVSQFSKMVFGVTDKMESAIRNLMEPEYSRNTKQIYIRDIEGNLYKNNFSYVDPYDVIKKPFRTIALAFADGKRTQKDRDKILFDGMVEALVEFQKPFIEEAILTESIIDIYNHYARNGKTKDGRQIEGWNNDPDASEAAGDNLAASFKHAFASFIPGSVPQLSKLVQSWGEDSKLESGQELEPALELIANFTGIRWNKVTEQYVAKSLERKIGTYSRAVTEINKESIDRMQGGYKDEAGYEHTYNEKDVINTYLDLSKRHYKATMNLKLAQDAAIDLYEDLIEVDTGSTGKVPVKLIFEQKGLDKQKLTPDEYQNLIHNRYSPLQITDSTWEKIEEKNDFKWMTIVDLKAIINSYQRGFGALPLLDLERSEYRDNAKQLLETRADEIFEERGILERNKKFKGGEISKDYPVANAIKDPSERVDPSTGVSYDNPLERFGFKGGGLMNGVSDPLSRLGFKGGGLMLSVGVSPVSEEQISKLKKSLKKRAAKREGGESLPDGYQTKKEYNDYTRVQYRFGDRIKKRLAERRASKKEWVKAAGEWDNRKTVQQATARAKDLKEGRYFDKERLIEVIKKDEGYRSRAYKPDPTEKDYTIGYGFYGAKKGDRTTREDADKRLSYEVDNRIETLIDLLPESKFYNKQLQDALFSVHWRGDIAQSGETRKLIKKGHYNEAAVEFLDHEEYRNAVALGIPGIRPRMERFSTELERLHDIRGYVPD